MNTKEIKAMFSQFSDRQLDEIYYHTVGHRPISEEGTTRETVIEILTGWENESGEAPFIPENINNI